MKKLLFIFTVIIFFPACIAAQNKTGYPTIFAKSYDYVNDFEKILTPSQAKSLNDLLKSSETKTKSKILIVTTSSIDPYADLNEYSRKLDHYMLSQLKIDTSILIVISKQLRQIQVQGVEKIRTKLNDQEIKELISAYIVPELKKGDYYKGLQQGVVQLVKKIE